MIGGTRFARLMERKTTGQKRKQKNKNRRPMNVKLQENKHGFYAEDHLERMGEMLAEYWSQHLDGEAVEVVLFEGNDGYKNLPKEALIHEFESVFGENYFSQD